MENNFRVHTTVSTVIFAFTLLNIFDFSIFLDLVLNIKQLNKH